MRTAARRGLFAVSPKASISQFLIYLESISPRVPSNLSLRRFLTEIPDEDTEWDLFEPCEVETRSRMPGKLDMLLFEEDVFLP